MENKLDRDELVSLTLEHQNVEAVARLKGVASTSVWYHLKRAGVTRRGKELIQLKDGQVESVLKESNYDIDETANRLNVDKSFVQACIIRLHIERLKGQSNG